MAYRNSEGKGGLFELESKGMGGYLQLELRKHGEGGGGGGRGVLDLGFPQETDKSVFLDKANFMDF